MSQPSRALYFGAAVCLHAAVLWGVTLGPPAFISDEGEQGEAMEVGLVESANEVAAEPTPEPPAPEPLPPEPPEPEVVPEPPPPPPDAIPEPTPLIEPPPPKPAPKPRPKPAARSSAPTTTAPANSGLPFGSPGAGAGKPGPGDNAHATWRNRIKPAYPPSARTAKQTGRVLIVVNVSPLGEATGARIYTGSGFPALDQAALSAARNSTFNPKKIAGIPLSDTITVPYFFRLEDP